MRRFFSFLIILKANCQSFVLSNMILILLFTVKLGAFSKELVFVDVDVQRKELRLQFAQCPCGNYRMHSVCISRTDFEHDSEADTNVSE